MQNKNVAIKNNMEKGRITLCVLSAFLLKILACIFMAIDHVGVAIFPQINILRIIGRIAFPIFAFFIAEGCRYTKNKIKRFVLVFTLGVVCETAYYIYTKEFYGNILLTFSLSILLIYLLQEVKKHLFNKQISLLIFWSVLFVLSIIAVKLLTQKIYVDYGFYGVLTPVFVSLFDFNNTNASEKVKVLDCKLTKLFCLSVALVLLWYFGSFDIQIWSLLSIPLLLLYNGKRGRFKFKYGFYIFYPLHLLLIEFISMFI